MDFDDYVRASGGRLLRLAYLLTGDRHVAEDLLQDAYARLLPKWSRVSRHDEPDAYVRRMLVNGRTSRWRQSRREDLVEIVPEGTTGDATTGVDTADELARALAHLGPRQRAVIVLRYYLDLSESEIAALLGISQGTVKSQSSRALAALRGHITPPVEV